MTIETQPGTLSVAQTAVRLGVSTNTLYRLVAAGNSPVRPLRIGSRIRFSAAAVEAYLEASVEGAA